MVKGSESHTAQFVCSMFPITFPSIEVNEAQAYCIRLELIEQEDDVHQSQALVER